MDLDAKLNTSRIIQDTVDLVGVYCPTGNSHRIAQKVTDIFQREGFEVQRFDLVPDNPTLLIQFGDDNSSGRGLIFNGHMDVVPLVHPEPIVKDGRIYGRGACDMKGSIACIIEVLRVLKTSAVKLNGPITVVINSLHESPVGRGEDLELFTENVKVKADAAVVMEGATRDCTIAQFGSATFVIKIIRDGQPSHQLYTPATTPHPIIVATDLIQKLQERNEELGKTLVEDIGYESYFVGRIDSGQFYNQMPKVAEIEGIRRYSPEKDFAQIEMELKEIAQEVATRYQVTVEVDIRKVRDGYRINKNSEIIKCLVDAVDSVRRERIPLVGKKVVTDAGIFVRNMQIPAVCHGPDARTAHGETEFVEIEELELTSRTYLRLIENYIGISSDAQEENA